jgi:hypothetical protein
VCCGYFLFAIIRLMKMPALGRRAGNERDSETDQPGHV